MRLPRWRRMDRLHIWQKLALLGVVFALLFAIPTTLYFAQVAGAFVHTGREIEGLGRGEQGLALLRSLSLHRAASASTLAGDAALLGRRDEAATKVATLFESLRRNPGMPPRAQGLLVRAAASWKTLADGVRGKVLQPADSNTRHAELIADADAALEAMLDADGLAVDSEPAVHYAVRAALLDVPSLLESLGQAEAQGLALLGARSAGQAERESTSAALLRAKEREVEMRAALRKVVAQSEELKAQLAPALLDAAAGIDKAVKSTRVSVIFSQDLSRPAAEYLAEQQEATEAQVRLSGRLLAEVRARLQARISAQRTTIGIAVGLALVILAGAVIVSIWTVRSITRPLGHAVAVAGRIAAGRLDEDIDRQQARNAEAAKLLEAFGAMQASLSGIAREIQAASDQIRHASVQVADGNADLSGRTESQASSLEQTAATMEELTATVKRNADSSAHASEVVNAASESAMRGSEAVAGVVATMRAINEASRRIVDIIAVIDSIAFQTNILALNAAVEAARAGEHGRGFAVVASEVRNLARRSADSAKEIKALIAESVQAASLGAKRVDETGSAMDDIMDSVRRVAQIFAEISSASSEQRNGIEQVNKAVTQMDRGTQENAALVGEVSASSQALQDQAQRLAELVGRFQLDSSAPHDEPGALLEGRTPFEGSETSRSGRHPPGLPAPREGPQGLSGASGPQRYPATTQ
jgi:methyl-accepting chemotaxis protein